MWLRSMGTGATQSKGFLQELPCEVRLEAALEAGQIKYHLSIAACPNMTECIGFSRCDPPPPHVNKTGKGGFGYLNLATQWRFGSCAKCVQNRRNTPTCWKRPGRRTTKLWSCLGRSWQPGVSCDHVSECEAFIDHMQFRERQPHAAA